MIRHLADFATPLNAAVYKEPFSWIEEEEKAFAALKILLTRAPVVQLLCAAVKRNKAPKSNCMMERSERV
jgi:hypothetical protein